MVCGNACSSAESRREFDGGADDGLSSIPGLLMLDLRGARKQANAAAMLPTAPDRSCHAEAEAADEPRSSRYRLNSGDGEVRIHGRSG